MLSGNDTRSDGEPAAEAEVRIPNRLGLHARPAAEFVKTSSRFDSAISVEKEGLEVNGKSIMGVMMLAASKGVELELEIDGSDEDACKQALVDLIEGRFGEGE